jgi:hypothetical protein
MFGNSPPKGKCPGCGKRFTLDLKGQKWVIPSHNLRIAGKINPECPGTGTVMQ